ncbi:hypothetical protein A3A84_02495 [Candidatus Collierbacteria bacterium RIFCSPLOWO2_01_FULL_50_23]|uniref:Uncharacterized protein n=1 Tax=Candidatus Collierbacteria bacterium RIFCSPHIGHO2_01_FULL_50_25 TaxID=1817722 RepID=A0A1F5EXW9_9BACT|nr:MAG: hypothetical protein A2703_02705 [Candidatus Collierbacteria bacterium RIFCSPHIGHO2_01_FULL_50_25]OGD73826.1 MAG: hypothetical protein A3A84_02495 [Candidatus Collierbacteria bacterium RIFCSPLOWO2_01_FULL_50_23]
MTKTQKFLKNIQAISIAPPENIIRILELIDNNKPITFFSWKMFGIKMTQKGLIANPSFDTDEADKYIIKEKNFIKTLLKLEINFKYIKLIPNELPKVFFGVNLPKESTSFAVNVSRYFKKIYPKTKVIKLSELLSNRPLALVYQKAFAKGQTENIDPKKFAKEKLSRSTYYSDEPLSNEKGTILAQKAFGLFSAETAIIFKYITNPVLLAGARSIDTYKYKFSKYPKDRPILPILFVL